MLLKIDEENWRVKSLEQMQIFEPDFLFLKIKFYTYFYSFCNKYL